MAKRTHTERRKMRRLRIVTGAIIVLSILVIQAFRGNNSTTQIPSTIQTPNSESEIPAPADLIMVKTNPELDSHLLNYAGHSLSFNPTLHIPNWVAWELTAGETHGDVKRASKFIVDAEVAGCADPSDYTNSGYDRGHMAPAADMKWSADAMTGCFYMTNICPQAKVLNTGTWNNLENKCRVWARADSVLIIVCGPVLTDSLTKTIGQTRVAVPERFFKVILAPYANPPRGIGFLMNNGKVEGGMQASSTTIDEVERVTGHDFFYQLPDSMEQIVESQNDFNRWSRIK